MELKGSLDIKKIQVEEQNIKIASAKAFAKKI